MEERGIEQLRAEYEEVDDVVKSARELVADEAKGIGGGWNSKGRAWLANYDQIFRRKGDSPSRRSPDERGVQGRGVGGRDAHGGDG